MPGAKPVIDYLSRDRLQRILGIKSQTLCCAPP
jgi:hypothetical protein